MQKIFYEVNSLDKKCYEQFHLSEDILIKTVDNKYFIGEFMYDRESEIEIRTIDDFPEVIQKADIEKTYAIVAFYTSRKKLPIST